MTPEERESIINEAVEKAMLVLPDVWANLIKNHLETTKKNSVFYKENLDFKGHNETVVSVIDEIDGKYPLLSYEDKLRKAAPIIRDRIKVKNSLDLHSVNRNPDRTFQTTSNHGEI